MLRVSKINFGCHQIPERCFCYKGKQMPFCARCLGCSIGHILSFILFISGYLPSILMAILFVIPLGIDWSVQKFFGKMSTNNRRLVTGILGGLGVGVIIWRLVVFLSDSLRVVFTN